MSTFIDQIAIVCLLAPLGCTREESSAFDASMLAFCPVGDLNATPEVEIVHFTETNELVRTSSGAMIPIAYAIQGGEALRIGARVRNLDACSVQLKLSLRDPCTERILVLDDRPIRIHAEPDGWAGPVSVYERGSYSVLPICTASSIDRPIDGDLFTLHMTVEDRAGRRAEASTSVRPSCVGPLRAICARDCTPGHVLGQTDESTDGGSGD